MPENKVQPNLIELIQVNTYYVAEQLDPLQGYIVHLFFRTQMENRQY